MAWDIRNCENYKEGVVSEENKVGYKNRKGGASALTDMPDYKCGRAIAYNSNNGHIAVGCNDGTIIIKKGIKDLGNTMIRLKHA
jgi:hypothetical protein